MISRRKVGRPGTGDTSVPPFLPHPALGCLGLLPGCWLLAAEGAWLGPSSHQAAVSYLCLRVPVTSSCPGPFRPRPQHCRILCGIPAPCPHFSNTPCIILSSNYPICMCHLFPAGTLTDTVFLICLCTISAYTLTPTRIYSLTHARTRTHACTHSVTRRHIPTLILTLTHRHSPSPANSHATLTHGSVSSQLWGVGCSGQHPALVN